MSRLIAIGREVARRRPPGSVADKIAKLGDAERAEVLKYLDEMDAQVQRKLLQLESPNLSNDRANSDRQKLIWRYSLAATLALSCWAGHWQARTYLVKQQQQQQAVSHAVEVSCAAAEEIQITQ